MSKMVRIQSSVTINVTAGLQYNDYTDATAPTPNRLKVSPTWTNAMVLIKTGVGEYPAEIVEWDSVKALERDGLVTIGAVKDVELEGDEKREHDIFEESLEKIAPAKKTTRRKSLDALTEE